jgi:hypothetical protein
MTLFSVYDACILVINALQQISAVERMLTKTTNVNEKLFQFKPRVKEDEWQDSKYKIFWRNIGKVSG